MLEKRCLGLVPNSLLTFLPDGDQEWAEYARVMKLIAGNDNELRILHPGESIQKALQLFAERKWRRHGPLG